MSTNTYNNNNNSANNYNDNEKWDGDPGVSMLNHRPLRLSVYMVILLCAAVPSCILYGTAIDYDLCPTDDTDYRDCNASAAAWFLLLATIVISGFIMWLIPNSNAMSNRVVSIVLGIFFLLAAILLFVGLMLSYDEMNCDPDNETCLLYIGLEWFVFSHVFLLGIDVITDYASDTSKRLLSYCIMYFIGCCILFEPFFENDDPSDSEEVSRAGLILICIGSAVAAICCIVNLTQKRTMSSSGTGQWVTRILALCFILGAILFMVDDPFFSFLLALAISNTIGLIWVMLIGLIVHGYDTMCL